MVCHFEELLGIGSPGEPVPAQRYQPGDGKDRKLYCIGGQMFGINIVADRDQPYVAGANPFPGFKGVLGAAVLLADYIYAAECSGAAVAGRTAAL